MLIWEAKRVKLTLSGLAIHCDCLWLVWPLLLAFIAGLPFRKVFTITLFHRIKLFRTYSFAYPVLVLNQFDLMTRLILTRRNIIIVLLKSCWLLNQGRHHHRNIGPIALVESDAVAWLLNMLENGHCRWYSKMLNNLHRTRLKQYAHMGRPRMQREAHRPGWLVCRSRLRTGFQDCQSKAWLRSL